MDTYNKTEFSIVISVYNRPESVVRCIKSCLQQTWPDFEVIVVDDGSSDETGDVLETFASEPRVSVIRLDSNYGMSVARREGIDRARGAWVLRIDSDHGLVPTALQTFHEHIISLPAGVGIVGARYQWDTGLVTPSFVPDLVVDYRGRIEWVEAEGGTDYLSCVRRDVYTAVPYPRRRGTVSALMQYDMAAYTDAHYIPDLLGLQYTDATNSYHRATRSEKIRTRIKSAVDQVVIYEELLSRHGTALQTWGPRQFWFFTLMAGFNHFLVGDRKMGVNRLRTCLRLCPTSFLSWGVLAAGLMGRRVLATAYVLRRV